MSAIAEQTALSKSAQKKIALNQKKKLRKKLSKQKRKVEENLDQKLANIITEHSEFNKSSITINPDEEIELFAEEGAVYDDFARVIERFRIPKEEELEEEEENKDEQVEEYVEQPKKKSKKQLKAERRPSVAVLKQLVRRPDLVEIHDVASSDPVFLVHLKSVRNSVGVPSHWCKTTRYLAGKRGHYKPTYTLPDYIQATGIMHMRETALMKDESKNIRQIMKERMRPKMGKITIDYEVLQDAFFKNQTKPKMNCHGDVYYEGKEFEVSMREQLPGHISDDLKKALGMVDGLPPPYLLNMQRYGMPPAYPGLRIPGLNAPIPEGAAWGYQPGGWGKAPTDPHGQPLFGDVFGTAIPKPPPEVTQPIERIHWGECHTDEEEEESEEEVEDHIQIEEREMEEEEEEEETEKEKDAAKVVSVSSTFVPSSIIASTPSSIDVAKQSEKKLYTELEMEEVKDVKGLFAPGFRYRVPGSEDEKANAHQDEDMDGIETFTGTETEKKKKEKEKKKFKF